MITISEDKMVKVPEDELLSLLHNAWEIGYSNGYDEGYKVSQKEAYERGRKVGCEDAYRQYTGTFS